MSMRREDVGGDQSPNNTESMNYILTHDLNNKLTIIKGYTDLLLDETDDPDAVNHQETIKRQALSAEALISTVGGQTRSSSQNTLEPVDVSDVLSEEVDRQRSAYPNANISVDINEPVMAAGGELFHSCSGIFSKTHTNTKSPRHRRSV